MDKKLRRASWPGIASALSAYSTTYTSKEHKPKYRKYYVDGVRPEVSERSGMNALLVHLLCDPDASAAQWQQWKQEHDEPHKHGYISGFWHLQTDDSLYFGNNSVFGRREQEIYDYFLVDYLRRNELTRALEDEVSELLRQGVSECILYLNRMAVNPHDQIYRKVETFANSVRLQSDMKYHYNRVSESENLVPLTWAVCPIAFGAQNADRLHPKQAHIVNTLHELFTDLSVQPELREAYEYALDYKYQYYLQESGALGRVSVAIRCKSQEQRDAMIKQIDPASRFPCTPEDPDGLVRSFPSWRGKNLRASYVLITTLWRAGFVADKVFEVDDNVLVVQCTCPLLPSKMLQAVTTLELDPLNLDERIKSRTYMKGDAIFEDADVLDLVYFIESITGHWKVCAPRRLEEECHVMEVRAGVCPVIDRLVGDGSSPEEFLPAILLNELKTVRENGEREDTELNPW